MFAFEFLLLASFMLLFWQSGDPTAYACVATPRVIGGDVPRAHTMIKSLKMGINTGRQQLDMHVLINRLIFPILSATSISVTS